MGQKSGKYIKFYCIISLMALKQFLNKNNLYFFILLAVFLWVAIFSLISLTTKPALWSDEGIAMELSRNFLNYGKLDVQTAPGEFSNMPYLLQAIGYPVTIPLALIFELFGIGPVQARLYMLLWMLAALIVLFFFLKKLFGAKEAAFSLLLIATFASFYANGRPVTGEILGFVFLILGFYSWFFKDSYLRTGFWWGLSAVTKPSICLLLVPAIFLVLLLQRENFFRRIIKLGLGMLPSAAGWIFLMIGNPFSKSAWVNLLHFYANPFGSAPITENIIRNFSGILRSSTLIYFGILFLLVIFARCISKERNINLFYNFIIIYSFLAFVYYLRSPGWLRYILISELLILAVLPKAVYSIAEKYRARFGRIKKYSVLPAFILSLLVVIQFVHLFTSAQIFYSDSALKTISILNEDFKNKSVGIVNAPVISVFLKTDKRFQAIRLAGIPDMGRNPLFDANLPEVIVLPSEQNFIFDGKEILDKNYKSYGQGDKFDIYVLLAD